MGKKVSHLKDELRRTFTIYALIPTFIVSSLIFILAFVYWNINVVKQAQKQLELACSRLDTTISGYIGKANDVAALCDIDELLDDKTARMEIYADLYKYINNNELKAEFYIFDQKLNSVVANKAQYPEFVQLARDIDWGIVRQIKLNPTIPNFMFVSDTTGMQMDLVVGKAILEKGKIVGYVFFVLPETQLVALINAPAMHFIIKDKYDNILLGSDEFFYDPINKVKPELVNAEGYFSLNDRKYYVCKQKFLNGELTFYVLNPIAGMVSQLTNVLVMLICLLIVLVLSILLSVKRQVEKKTRIIDQIVEAFSAVKNGDLEKRLYINTNNEFQIIGEAYNMMLSSLKDLMRTNQEKARATVISEIKQLESQFNPHFLFNTLENIKFMIKLEPDVASKMIVALSNLLRYSIDNTSSEVSIQEDITYTQNYLKIQKARFGQRLNYIIDLPEELNNALVPKLVSQPIIENAIKYGFNNCQHLMIKIKISRVGNKLIILINNNGTEIEERVMTEIRTMLASKTNCSEHCGLYNVNRRIKLMYGEHFGLDIISSHQEGTSVKIVLPFHKNSEYSHLI